MHSFFRLGLTAAFVLCSAACSSSGLSGNTGAEASTGTGGTTGGATTGSATSGGTTGGGHGAACSSSSDCGTAFPCCAYDSQSCVTLEELGPSGYCTCNDYADCAFDHYYQECVPLLTASGYFVGPYACIPNDGKYFDGCRDGVACSVPGQYCATDLSGSKFCSVPCEFNKDCQNPGVACCNTTCDATGGACCGLCGH